MADFSLLGIAVEQALELPKNTFINRYRANRSDAKESVLESSPIMLALIEFIEKQSDQFWRGRPSDLLEKLTEFKNPSPHTSWPRTSHAMGGDLRRYMASLLSVGIIVVSEQKTSDKKNKAGNFYRISKKNDTDKTNPPSPLSPPVEEALNNHAAFQANNSVDMIVDLVASTSATPVLSPHSKNSDESISVDISGASVDSVDIVDFKNQFEIVKENKDDRVLI